MVVNLYAFYIQPRNGEQRASCFGRSTGCEDFREAVTATREIHTPTENRILISSHI
jgi:hypothetical protein